MKNRSSVIVALLILAVLAGLCTPLIMRLRDESRIGECKNHLKQLGVGLHNYHDANTSFPLAAMKSDTVRPQRRLSWMFELDPYIHARMDPDWVPMRERPWDSEENLRIARGTRGRMPWYLCPGNPHTQVGELAVTHYVGIAGVGSHAADLPKKDAGAGVFGFERTTGLDDIEDGPATTLMVVETMRDNGPWIAGGFPTVRGLVRDDQPYVGQARQLGGAHRDSTVVLMADGSIRSIRNSIDPRTFEALATISASDEIGPFVGD